MKAFPLLLAVSLCSTLPTVAAPSKKSSSPISQIVVTSYTGNDSNGVPDPIHRIVLKRDGSAVYVGSATYSFRVGRYQGRVNKNDFQRLTNLFQQNNFRSGPTTYSDSGRPNMASTKYEVTFADGKKSVKVYGDCGPQFFDRIDHLWYGLLWKINWHKVSSSDALTG